MLAANEKEKIVPAQSTSVYGLVSQLQRLITKKYSHALMAHDITPAQYQTLKILSEGTTTAVALGRSLDVEKSTMCRNLKRLVEIGAITMGPPKGRHGRLLAVTSHGMALLLRTQPLWEEVSIELSQLLPSTLFQEIRGAIQKVGTRNPHDG